LQRQRKWSHLRPCACADIPTPCMQGSCREAVLGWLWTLAGANEPRSAGGEKGVLRDEATLPGAPPARPRAACAPHRTMLFPQTFCKCSLCTLCGPPGSAQHCPSPHRAWSPQRLPAAGGAAPARRAPHAQAPARAGCSDRLALGGAALCLRFCRPFLGGEARFMARLDPAFYQEQAFRRGARHPTLYPNPTPPYTRSAAGQAL